MWVYHRVQLRQPKHHVSRGELPKQRLRLVVARAVMACCWAVVESPHVLTVASKVLRAARVHAVAHPMQRPLRHAQGHPAPLPVQA